MTAEDELKLPEHLREKAASFLESSMGANRVKLDLKDGRRIYDVSLAWGETIVKVGNRQIKSVHDLDFTKADITDVISEARQRRRKVDTSGSRLSKTRGGFSQPQP